MLTNKTRGFWFALIGGSVVLFLSWGALPAELRPKALSMERVIARVLQDSLEYKKLKAGEGALFLPLARAGEFLDWRILAQSRLESHRLNLLEPFENPLKEDWNFLIGVEKTFLTGTHIKFMHSFLHTDRLFSPGYKNLFLKGAGVADRALPPEETVRIHTVLQIEQDLLKNFFGREDRLFLQTARARVQHSQLQMKEKMEGLIIRAVGDFWRAYLSRVLLDLKKSQKKDYRELMNINRKKARYGYLRPGEFYQIRAEWERARQELTLQQADYADQKTRLLNLLKMRETKAIEFKISKTLPAPVDLTLPRHSAPRLIQLAQKNLLIRKKERDLEKTRALPALKLFGSYGLTGYDREFSSSYRGLAEGENRDYAVGVKFQYPIFSTSLRQKRVFFREQAVEEGEQDLAIVQREFDRLLKVTQQDLQSLYRSVKSAKKISNLRKASYKEIRKAYLQGRLSVFELITARDLTLRAHIQKAQLTARYYETLVYAYALKDQLVEKYTQNP